MKSAGLNWKEVESHCNQGLQSGFSARISVSQSEAEKFSAKRREPIRRAEISQNLDFEIQQPIRRLEIFARISGRIIRDTSAPIGFFSNVCRRGLQKSAMLALLLGFPHGSLFLFLRSPVQSKQLCLFISFPCIIIIAIKETIIQILQQMIMIISTSSASGIEVWISGSPIINWRKLRRLLGAETRNRGWVRLSTSESE